jgi:hypothetical protein
MREALPLASLVIILTRQLCRHIFGETNTVLKVNMHSTYTNLLYWLYIMLITIEPCLFMFPGNADTTCTRKHGLQRDMNRVYLYFQRMQTLQKLKSTGLLHAIEQAGRLLGDDNGVNGVSRNIYIILFI